MFERYHKPAFDDIDMASINTDENVSMDLLYFFTPTQSLPATPYQTKTPGVLGFTIGEACCNSP
jgi:hypothetical protein